jgi:hypothetical protein
MEAETYPDKKYLNPSEWLLIVTVPAKHVVNSIQHIGTKHTYFVDNQQIEFSQHLYFRFAKLEVIVKLLFPFEVRDKWLERKL